MRYFIPASVLLHILFLAIWTMSIQNGLPTGSPLQVTILETVFSSPVARNRPNHAQSDNINNTRQDVSSSGRIKKQQSVAKYTVPYLDNGIGPKDSPFLKTSVMADDGKPGHDNSSLHPEQNRPSVSLSNNQLNNGVVIADQSIDTRNEATGLSITKQLTEIIDDALIRSFKYPMLARKRGWQGTVHLGFHISTSGRLSNIRMISSSGHRSLDNAAMKSLQQLAIIPQVSRWLSNNGIDLEFPVIYRLEEI